MNCPKCGSGSRVKYSRKRSYGVHRRRHCKSCEMAWSTTERAGLPGQEELMATNDQKMAARFKALEGELFELNKNLGKLLEKVK